MKPRAHHKGRSISTLGVWPTYREEIVPTQFEQLVNRLGIGPDDWARSPEVQSFVRRFLCRYWIPESLLDELDVPKKRREGKGDGL